MKTRFCKGDKACIVSNRSCHPFKIGQIVTISHVNVLGNFYTARASAGDADYYVEDGDLMPTEYTEKVAGGDVKTVDLLQKELELAETKLKVAERQRNLAFAVIQRIAMESDYCICKICKGCCGQKCCGETDCDGCEDEHAVRSCEWFLLNEDFF